MQNTQQLGICILKWGLRVSTPRSVYELIWLFLNVFLIYMFTMRYYYFICVVCLQYCFTCVLCVLLLFNCSMYFYYRLTCVNELFVTLCYCFATLYSFVLHWFTTYLMLLFGLLLFCQWPFWHSYMTFTMFHVFFIIQRCQHISKTQQHTAHHLTQYCNTSQASQKKRST